MRYRVSVEIDPAIEEQHPELVLNENGTPHVMTLTLESGLDAVILPGRFVVLEVEDEDA